MYACHAFQRTAQPSFYSRADLDTENALEALAEKLAALPNDANNEEFVRAQTMRGVFKIMFLNRDDYGEPEGPLQKVLTVYYGDDRRSATVQAYCMRDTQSRETMTPDNIATPKTDSPEGWQDVVKDWARALYRSPMPTI